MKGLIVNIVIAICICCIFEVQAHKNVVVVPLNTVQAGVANFITVAKSGGDFTSLNDALDSITDSSQGNGYQIYIAPGDYVVSKRLILTPYISIRGAGRDLTKLTSLIRAERESMILGADNISISGLSMMAASTPSFPLLSILSCTARSNNGISLHDVSIEFEGNTNDRLSAISCQRGSNAGFSVTSSSIAVRNSAGPVATLLLAFAGVIIDDSIIAASSGNSNANRVAVFAGSDSSADVNDSDLFGDIQAIGGLGSRIDLESTNLFGTLNVPVEADSILITNSFIATPSTTAADELSNIFCNNTRSGFRSRFNDTKLLANDCSLTVVP